MDVLLHQVDECPLNLLLLIYCRVVKSSGNSVLLEDLATDLVVSAVVTGDVEIPVPDTMVQVQAVKYPSTDSSPYRLDLMEFDLIDDPHSVELLTDPEKLQLIAKQARRSLKAVESSD